jgi:hypothetical protein
MSVLDVAIGALANKPERRGLKSDPEPSWRQMAGYIAGG